jgi:hypothetical protein
MRHLQPSHRPTSRRVRSLRSVGVVIGIALIGAVPVVAAGPESDPVSDDAASVVRPRTSSNEAGWIQTVDVRPVAPPSATDATEATGAGRDPSGDGAGVDRQVAATDRTIDADRWGELSPEELRRALGLTPEGSRADVNGPVHAAAMAAMGVPLVADADWSSGPSAAAWAALRECESGGDYSIVSRTGRYRGAYQFSRSTWDSVAADHAPDLVGVDPAAATPAEQDAMARALYADRGAQPWPHCGRHLP